MLKAILREIQSLPDQTIRLAVASTSHCVEDKATLSASVVSLDLPRVVH